MPPGAWSGPCCACPFPVPSPFPPPVKAFWGVLPPPAPVPSGLPLPPCVVRSLLVHAGTSLFKSHDAYRVSLMCQLSHSSNYALKLPSRSSFLSHHQMDTWEATSRPPPGAPLPVLSHLTLNMLGRALAGAEHRDQIPVTQRLSLNRHCGVGPLQGALFGLGCLPCSP